MKKLAEWLVSYLVTVSRCGFVQVANGIQLCTRAVRRETCYLATGLRQCIMLY